MPRYRNDTGSVLDVFELGVSLGPGDEADSDLPIPGCTLIEDKPKRKPAAGPASGDVDKETLA